MTSIELKKLLMGTTLIAGFTAFASAPTFAQDAEPIETTTNNTIEEDDEDGDNEIVVTGSRIKKDEFTSIAPIQIVDFEAKRDVGLIDTASILQTTESAAGQQIDSTFGGFVLDNGPGSETINIRGLGAGRTLVLLNGRRIAPSGVEGAPAQPSINLIPSSLVDRVDILLEGASSVYGSDAVAGVVNVLLDQNLEGFDFAASGDFGEISARDDYNLSGSWGKTFDRGSIGIGAEYDYRDAIKYGDLDFFSGCDTHYEIDENGQIRTQDVFDQTRFDVWFGGTPGEIQSAENTECKSTAIAGRVFEGSTFGSFYYTGGQTNIGIPGYVDQNLAGVPIDSNQDGIQDFGFQQFSINGRDLEADFVPEQKRLNLMAFGEFTIDGAANITPYFEVLHSKLDVQADNGTFQLFPEVSATNPFNPCGLNGSDCGSNGFNFTPEFVSRWNSYYRDADPNRDGNFGDARACAAFFAASDAEGNLIPGTGPFDNAACTPFLFGYGPGDFVGPRSVTPIVGVDGDRTDYSVNIDNTRLVGGLRGDLPFMSDIGLEDWSFDVSATHSISHGESERPGIRDDRLNYALGNAVVPIRDGNGDIVFFPGDPINFQDPCTPQFDVVLDPSVTEGCVPVNLFAPSLYQGIVGDFATSAERNYLFDVRNFDTKYWQTVLSAYATGKLFKTAAGDVSAVVGLEYREDSIDSSPDNIARDGLFFGFFSDGGGQGSTNVKEAFAEIDIPILADKTLFNRLDLNLSGRLVDDKYYGGAETYSIKAGWRPIKEVFFKAGYGTSFRSPNLRELFLRPQSGFLGVLDPCAVPPETTFRDFRQGSQGVTVYDPSRETRTAYTLEQCANVQLAPNVFLDPTTFNVGNGNVFSTEIFNEGSLDLEPETSTSLTLGVSVQPELNEDVDVNFGATYYEIDVENSVVSPGAQFMVNDCFVTERSERSIFCDRIRRSSTGRIQFLDATFINLDKDVARGIDFNGRLGYEFSAFDRPFEFDLDVRANHILEVSNEYNDGGRIDPIRDNNEGEFGFAEWVGTIRPRLRYDDFSFTWETRFIDAVNQDADGVDEFGNALGVDTDGNGTPDAFSDTCGGPVVGDVNCRDVGFADEYLVHSAGISYNNEDNGFGVTFAVSNVFNTDPPKVDSSEVTAVSNTPIGVGYNTQGRKFFVQLRKSFK